MDGIHPLETILNPRGIVYFGANNNVLTMGTTQLLNIIGAGFPGEIYPVHPKLETVLGMKAYPSLDVIPASARIDLAFIVIAGKHVPGIIDECGKRGITHAVIISAGFREMDNTGLNRQLLEAAAKHGTKFIGPNCIGFYNRHLIWVDEQEHDTKAINTTWIPINPRSGGTSIASQSGTFACHIFLESEKIGMGFSKTISVGNEATLDLVDCLEFLEQDPRTTVIGLYIEEIKRGRRFLEVAARVARKKPIVAVYVGGTGAGARGVKSHTGSLGGNDKIFDAACKQVGIIRAWNMEELLDYCHALDRCPIPKGNNLCIFTNAGGPGVNMGDLAERMGLSVPEFSPDLQEALRKKIKASTAQVRNIVDLTFDVDLEGLYRTLPRIIMKSREIDGMLVYGLFGWSFFKLINELAPSLPVPLDDIKALMEPLLKVYASLPRKFGVPIIAVSIMGRDEEAIAQLMDHGLPVYPMPNRAVKAYWALDQYRRVLDRAAARDAVTG